MIDITTVSSKRFADLPESNVCCNACGYCLRGKTFADICTECGLPIASSAARIADGLLAISGATGQTDARRRSDLNWGPWLILAGGAIFAGSLMFDDIRIGPFKYPMQAIATMLAAAGVLVSTRAAKESNEPVALRILRLFLRTAAAVSVLLSVLNFVVYPDASEWMRNADITIRVLLFYTNTVGTGLFMIYGGSVAWMMKRRDFAVPAFIIATALTLNLAFVIWYEPALPTLGGDARSVLGVDRSVQVLFEEAMNDPSYFCRGYANNGLAPIMVEEVLMVLRHGLAWGNLLVLLQFALMPRDAREK